MIKYQKKSVKLPIDEWHFLIGTLAGAKGRDVKKLMNTIIKQLNS